MTGFRRPALSCIAVHPVDGIGSPKAAAANGTMVVRDEVEQMRSDLGDG